MGLNSHTDTCPNCQSDNDTVRIVYGFPEAPLMQLLAVYGGTEANAASPTHFCTNCDGHWTDAEASIIWYPFPNECHFCNEKLSDTAKLDYSLAYDEWIDSGDRPAFNLRTKAQSGTPFPLCGECSESIEQNLSDLKQEPSHEDRDRRNAIRLYFFGAVTFTLFVLYAYILDPTDNLGVAPE